MKEEKRKNVIRSNAFLVLLAIVMLTTAVTKTAIAKSLYVIADLKGSSEEGIQPVQAYDIGVDGTLTFQAQYDIPHNMLGAVGMAIDSDYGYVFITTEASGEIQLIEATKMVDAGTTIAPDATNLAGIVYDHDKSLLYCVDRGTNQLYVYNWQPETATLTHVFGSPFTLRNASAFGIALDEIDDLLFVANNSNTVNVYSTSTWQLVNTITLSRKAISIAVDVNNGLLYTGAGFAGDMYLTQYDLATDFETAVQVEPDAGVIGLAVNPDTGYVYMSTGVNTDAGGDNLLVYDSALNQIDFIPAIGNSPTGLAIPGRDIGYNQLNLNKQVLRGATPGASPDDTKTVGIGDTYTYGIYFDNTNDFTVTDLSVVDILPKEVTFVSADDDGVNGIYEYNDKTKTHTYTWTYKELPPKTSTLLEITVQVNNDIAPGTIISNTVTINSNETAPTTTSVDVISGDNPLNLRKSIIGGTEDQVTQVKSNDIITYAIDFDNKTYDSSITEISVVDTISKDVTFISAKDQSGKDIGKFDGKDTWTWSFKSLKPQEEIHIELEVSVNPDTPEGTTITNSVSVNCNEIPPSSASVDAVVPSVSYKPLNITKIAMDSSGSEIEWIMPGESFIYKICFDNNNNDSNVTNVFLNDTFPSEVTFVSAQVDNDNFTGNYSLENHTYTGTLKSLEPGLVTCLELVVNVKQDTPVDTIISNLVTINSNETLPLPTDVHVVTIEPEEPDESPLEVDNLSITPNVLRRNGTSPRIKAVVQLPQGVNISDIDPDDRPVLYYQDRETGEFVEIGISESDSHPTGTEDRPTITVYFSRPELMNAAQYYGEVTLRIEGKLNTGQPYFGDTTIRITKFAGD